MTIPWILMMVLKLIHTDNETKLNTILNDFAKHLAFLKLKMMKENMLPASAVASILNDMQHYFDYTKNGDFR